MREWEIMPRTILNSAFGFRPFKATDRHSSEQPFNRPTDQRNSIENDHVIQP